MFVNSTNTVGVTQRVVATLVACAVVMATIGFYHTAQAANFTSVSNTLTDSTPSTLSGHTFAFTVPATGGTAIAPGDTTTITFDALFAGVTDVVDGDVTVTVNAADVSVAATVDGASATEVTITGITVAAGEEVVVAIANTRITNPAKVLADGIGDSYEFPIANANDSGNTRVVIIDNVVVTAEVATSFEFEVRPVDVGVTVNGLATTGSSSSTTIPFGELAVGVPEFIAQQLSVITNSLNGFVVTVEKDGELRSSTGADIDTFIDATNETTPTAWVSPDSTLAFGENGWGHWGMTTEDGDVNDVAAPNFAGTDEYIAVLDSPQTIFGHNSVCDGTTSGGGDATTDDFCLTEVGYRIEISSLQEAGDDYTATLTYIATPTF
jgi:hypothetical protein